MTTWMEEARRARELEDDRARKRGEVMDQFGSRDGYNVRLPASVGDVAMPTTNYVAAIFSMCARAISEGR